MILSTFKAVGNTVDTIKDDTENKPDTGFDSIMTSDIMERDETSNCFTMDNTKTIEGEDGAIAIELTNPKSKSKVQVQV